MRAHLKIAAVLGLALALGGTVSSQEAPAEVATEAAAVEAPAMTWMDAAELLKKERDAAEVCVRITKRFLPEGDLAALSEAELEYEAARSEFNAVITGLQVALIENAEQPPLDGVKTATAAGSEALRVFCDKAHAMILPPMPGEKGPIDEAVSGAVGAVIEAAVRVWERLRDDDAIRRNNLRTVLEDAKWPAFAAVTA